MSILFDGMRRASFEAVSFHALKDRLAYLRWTKNDDFGGPGRELEAKQIEQELENRRTLRPDEQDALIDASRNTCCGEGSEMGFICTRLPGHSGDHLAVDMTPKVCDRWK